MRFLATRERIAPSGSLMLSRIAAPPNRRRSSWQHSRRSRQAPCGRKEPTENTPPSLSLHQTVAEGLERSYRWEVPAAQRLRFVLDFAYVCGLRVSELVDTTLGRVEIDSNCDRWLHLVGKGSKAGKVLCGRWRGRLSIAPSPNEGCRRLRRGGTRGRP